MKTKARLIAFYLPQYHPIPENDVWWGKGFTEWTNVAKAKPLFNGHYQPRLPADLGYYDLRVPEVREAQAELARNAGIEGFCYYHYWFGGKRLLERPFNEVVASGKPDFPFCLCWANQTWSGIWHGAPDRVLAEQTYPGLEDYRNHFHAMREAFLDSRYLRIDGRLIYLIYRPTDLPDVSRFLDTWQELAIRNGLPGFHFVACLLSHQSAWNYKSHGYDSCVMVSNRGFSASFRALLSGKSRISSHGPGNADMRTESQILRREFVHRVKKRFRSSLGLFSNIRLYRDALPFLLEGCSDDPAVHPCLTPNWDNTARSQMRGYVLHESTPELFRLHVKNTLQLVRNRPMERRLVFVKSWNEWAEGNYLEPDQRFGHDYLNVMRQEVRTSAVPELIDNVCCA